MYYSSGNYEAFAKPKKPENVDIKSEDDESIEAEIQKIIGLTDIEVNHLFTKI